MAKAKTSTFYLRETIAVDATPVQSEMDLTVYVDPVNSQGLLIRAADFIWFDSTTFLPLDANADWQAAIQLHDSNLGGLVDLSNEHQVASGSITSISGSEVSSDQDFFPDRLGMAKGEGRIVVNDSLEIASDAGGASIPANMVCCVVLEVQVVKLNKEDYISLALQSVSQN
tara:strand:+ start:523 stop:1035 length:513 start_codon:yes stop_codon:yes gene_type:complete